MKTCVIITGGSIDCAFAGSFLRQLSYDYLIAVDGGLAAVRELGLCPDAVVGDFDTVSPQLLEEFRRNKEILFEEHQPEKDETDTELAIRTALRTNPGAIYLLGATGGRMDHTIGNLHLLYPCFQKGIGAYMVDEKNKIYLIQRHRSFHKSSLWGNYISFLPLTETVSGITLTGFRYPLNQKTIHIGTSLCISNELTEEFGEITCLDGTLICVESHD